MNIQGFVNAVNDSINGSNKGIPFTSKKLTDLTGGVLRGYSYLIMGPSKTGKTSFMYEEFIFNLIDRVISGEIEKEDLKIDLYSMEMSDTMFMFKAAARWIFYNGRHEEKRIITDTRQLLGNNGPPNTVLASYLKSIELLGYLELVKSIVTFISETSPSILFRCVSNSCGELSDYIGTDEAGKKKYRFKNSKLLYIVALDHVSLVLKDQNSAGEVKQIIDDTSTNLRRLKNAFGITPVLLQQITPPPNNGGLKKLTLGHMELRDSKNTFQDIDFCFSLGSPFHDNIKAINYKDGVYHIMPDEDNGDVGIGDRLRLLSVEKDRYGISSIRIALSYLGEIGLFADIAPPNEIDYAYYMNINKTF